MGGTKSWIWQPLQVASNLGYSMIPNLAQHAFKSFKTPLVFGQERKVQGCLVMMQMREVGPTGLPHTCNISCGSFSPVPPHALSHLSQALA